MVDNIQCVFFVQGCVEVVEGFFCVIVYQEVVNIVEGQDCINVVWFDDWVGIVVEVGQSVCVIMFFIGIVFYKMFLGVLMVFV